ncbi:hypothetical protein AB1Y20_018336 [Prymnesium parvum]|uniref:Nucleotidyl transferase domain-containing protein n=1 Tax=Prymnesium parvum TaxID=97485 RepID=A0AB34JN58_PRYPA
MKLGNEPMIGHVLKQLHAGGIRRAIIIVGAQAAVYKRTIRALPTAAMLQIEYVDLGEAYKDGFARSLLAAAPMIGSSPFVISTSDHIFDQSIVRALRTSLETPRSVPVSAVVLVEDHTKMIVDAALPSSAVYVQTERVGEEEYVIKNIGKRISEESKTGIEAGLFACTPAVFAALLALLSERNYFTLAHAMQRIATEGKLGAVFTEGRAWFSVETKKQLENVEQDAVHRGRATFPWQVSIVQSKEDDQHRLVLPISDSIVYHSLPAVASAQNHHFTVLKSSPQPFTAAAAVEAEGRASLTSLQQPLLEGFLPTDPTSRHPSPYLAATSAMIPRTGSSSSSYDHALSIPLPDSIDMGHTGYLFGMAPGSHDVEGGTALHEELRFAVPNLEAPHSLLGVPTFRLPSSIHSLKLQTVNEFGSSESHGGYASRASSSHHGISRTSSEFSLPPPTVKMTVERRVPLVGWALLVLALICSQSGGAATKFQYAGDEAHGKHLFLISAWRGWCTSLLLLLVTIVFTDSRHGLRALAHLEPRDVKLILYGGLALFVNWGAFNYALLHTSLSHAAIFETASSVWMVLGRLSLYAVGRVGAVPAPHVFGVLLGTLGMILCTRDEEPSASAVPITPLGDAAAIVSGIGACFNILISEAARLRIETPIYYSLVMAQFAVYCTILAFFMDDPPPVEMSLDEATGYLGWLNPTPRRLYAQLFIAVVCDWAGNMSWIVSMKYVPAIVVGAFQLLGPFVATVEGMSIGVEDAPGMYTIAGGTVIFIGSAVIALSERASSTTVDV